MSGLLSGMRVLDVSVWRPMPHATQILADLGAEVLKLEPPGADPMRQYPTIFAGVARGKRSIVVDLGQPSGRATVLELAAAADVFCEGFRPGVADRLGVGYAAVHAVNPSVVYCSISGFGQTGVLRDAPGHDLSYQAVAGAIRSDRDDKAPPPVPALPAADLAAGTYAAALVCAAWAKRLQTGEGERIDVAMADVIASWVGPADEVAIAGVERAASGSPGYGIFRAADGCLVTLASLSEQHLWDAVCDGLELADLRGLPFPERLARSEEVNGRIATAIARFSGEEAVGRLTAAGAPVMPVLTPSQMAAHAHFRSRGMVLEGSSGEAMALPAMLAHHPRRTETRVPSPGEHPQGFA